MIAAGVCALPYYALTDSVTAAALFAVAAVAIDVDHAVDYLLWNKSPLSLAGFFEPGSLLKADYLVFFLHSYEWVLALALLSWWTGSPEILAVTSGFGLHLLMDEAGNRLPAGPTRIKLPFYFIIYRVQMGFRIEKMCKT
jgi:hypothetical protein